jgi:hypothetical protein
MGPINCLEISVRNYHYLLHYSPEERSSHLLRSGSLKSSTDSGLWFCEANLLPSDDHLLLALKQYFGGHKF